MRHYFYWVNDLALNSNEPLTPFFIPQRCTLKQGQKSLLCQLCLLSHWLIYQKMLHCKTGFVLQLPYSTLHYVAPIYAIVACSFSVILWDFIFLRVRKVIVDSRTKCLVEACSPVLRPILDHPYENWESRGKDNHYNNKYRPAWVWSVFCPFIRTSTTVWFLMERVKLQLSIYQKLYLVPYTYKREDHRVNYNGCL